MLPKTWRIVAYNGTGVAFGASDSIAVTCIRKNVSPSTALAVYESAAATLLSGGASLAIAGYVAGTTQDNTAAGTGWFEGNCEVTIVLSTASPNGPVSFYKQFSPDGGTTWPDNGQGELVGSVNFTAAGTQVTNFSI